MSDPQQPKGLRTKSVSAAIWSCTDALLRQGLQVVISIWLARLLAPEDFGTIALLFLFMGFGIALVDGGFSSALVQQKEIDHTDESTVFWLNIGTATIVAALLWTAAPTIAAFYGHAILVPLATILAITLPIDALGAIHVTLLNKRLDFKTPMTIGAIATIISGTVAVSMAMAGYGVLALASQAFTASTVTTGLLWAVSPWRPRFQFSLASAGRLWNFGGYLMLSGLLDVTYNRLYTLLLGKFYSARDLGLYVRAENIKQMPADALSTAFGRVVFPVFARAAGDSEAIRSGMRHGIRSVMLINVPLMLGLMATAECVVRVLFGEQWLPSVPILQVLCLAGLFWPLHVINLNALKALGRSRHFARLEVIKKAIGVLLLCFGIQFGVMGIAWVQVVLGAAAFYVNAYYFKSWLSYGPAEQLRDILPVVLVGIAMLGVVSYASSLLNPGSPISLLTLVSIGAGTFFIGCRWFCPRTLADVTRLLRARR